MIKRTITTLSMLLVAGLATAQSHFVEYDISLSLGDDNFYSYNEQGEQAVGPIEWSFDVADYGNAYARANVGYGVNKAVVSMAGTNAANPVDYATGFASSRYWDYFIIDEEGLTGTAGQFTTQLYMEGVGDVRVDDAIVSNPNTMIEAFWHGVLHIEAEGIEDEFGAIPQNAFYAGEWSKYYDETELFYDGDDLNTYTDTVTFDFIYGKPIWVDMYLQTLILMDNQEGVAGTWDMNIDLGNSVYWGGIQSVLDGNGSLVSNYSFQSSSGVDYRQDLNAVPEPASLAALGLGALALLRRRRK